jgi:hypothetical protein
VPKGLSLPMLRLLEAMEGNGGGAFIDLDGTLMLTVREIKVAPLATARALMALCNSVLAGVGKACFTWDDVDVLRRASITVRIGDIETMQDDAATAHVQGVSARITALLPPREPV